MVNNNFEQRLHWLYEARNELNLDLETDLSREEIRDSQNFDKLFKDILDKSESILSRGISKIKLKPLTFCLSSEKLVRQKFFLVRYFLPKKKLKIIYQPLASFLNQLSEKGYGYSVGVTPSTPASIFVTVFLVNPEINEVYWADTYGQKMGILEQWLY